MALIFLNVVYEDEDFRQTKKRFRMNATTLTQAEIDAPTCITAFENVTKSEIRKWSLKQETESAIAAAVGSNIDAGMTIKAQLAGRTNKTSLKLPDPVAAVIASGGIVDVDGVLMQAVFDLFDTAGTPLLKISDGELLSAFISGTKDK